MHTYLLCLIFFVTSASPCILLISFFLSSNFTSLFLSNICPHLSVAIAFEMTFIPSSSFIQELFPFIFLSLYCLITHSLIPISSLSSKSQMPFTKLFDSGYMLVRSVALLCKVIPLTILHLTFVWHASFFLPSSYIHAYKRLALFRLLLISKWGQFLFLLTYWMRGIRRMSYKTFSPTLGWVSFKS